MTPTAPFNFRLRHFPIYSNVIPVTFRYIAARICGHPKMAKFYPSLEKTVGHMVERQTPKFVSVERTWHTLQVSDWSTDTFGLKSINSATVGTLKLPTLQRTRRNLANCVLNETAAVPCRAGSAVGTAVSCCVVWRL